MKVWQQKQRFLSSTVEIFNGGSHGHFEVEG